MEIEINQSGVVFWGSMGILQSSWQKYWRKFLSKPKVTIRWTKDGCPTTENNVRVGTGVVALDL